jgi:hypothetical protein|tara:strand:+ start:406 stop:663 length:258 start_codon:yes stop_codon:yes gene_type:complete
MSKAVSDRSKIWFLQANLDEANAEKRHLDYENKMLKEDLETSKKHLFSENDILLKDLKHEKMMGMELRKEIHVLKQRIHTLENRM